MKINPQSILPSLNPKKQRRLTLNKKQSKIQLPNHFLNTELTKIIKQPSKKSEIIKEKRSLSSTPKQQNCCLELILKVQDRAKSSHRRMRSQSQNQFLLKKSSIIEIQSENVKQQQSQKLQNQQISEQNKSILRPCHRKLLKNLFIKEKKTNFDFKISQRQEKTILSNDQIRNPNQKQEQTLDFFQIIKKQKKPELLLKQQNNTHNDKFQKFIQSNSPTLLIKQKDLPSKKINSIENNGKKYQDAGTITQLSLNNESYNQFMKFKLSQQDAYLKMKQLFSFIHNVSSQQTFKFQQRHQNLLNVINETVSTQRQSKIIELIHQIDKVQNDFSSTFLSYFKKLNQIGDKFNFTTNNQINTARNQIFKIKQSVANFNLKSDSENSYLSQNKENLILTSNSLKIDIDSRLSKIQKMLIDSHSKLIQTRQKISHQLLNNKSDLLKKFQAWQTSIDQKNFMTRVCINDLIRLPQISMVAFGMSKDTYTDQQIKIMKKIGITIDQVPQFQQFYEKQRVSKGPEKAFQQLRNLKCLNCAYFKSKMRAIHNTNCQLEPVLKILNHLIKNQNKKNYDFK